MEKVVALMIKGKTATQIAAELEIPRGRVVTHIENWKVWANHENDIKGRAKEMLAQIDQHYQMLLDESYQQLEEAKRQGSVRDATGVIKVLAQIEKDRTQIYGQAGITADDELANELAERERREALIIDLIKEIATLNPNLKVMIYKRLSQLDGNAQVIPIEQGDTA